MKTGKALVLGSVLSVGLISVTAAPANAADKKIATCDKSGKPCKKGNDCSPDNCKSTTKAKK